MFKKSLFLFAAIISCANILAENLSYMSPEKVIKIPYKAKLNKGGAVTISLGKNFYVIDSMFSTIPGWAKFTASKADNFAQVQGTKTTFSAANASFQISRKLIRHEECLEVVDSIKNLTKGNLPLMLRHQIKLGKVKRYRLCGYPKYGRRGRGSCSINCTAIALPMNGGSLGFLALNDVFKAHFQAFGMNGIYGIADNNLIIRPGHTQIMRWAVFPSKTGDYYVQINAMRRFLGVNYTYKGGGAWFIPYPRGVKTSTKGIDRIGKDHSDKEILNFLRFKGGIYTIDMPTKILKEKWHGDAWFNKHNTQVHRNFYKKLKKLRPETVCLHYYHCFIDQKHAMKDSYPACKMLTPSGKQADYSNPDFPLFLPIAGNKWAKLQKQRLDILFEDYQVDGIYWDEFANSAGSYHFGSPWDGVSGDINPRSHKIKGLKSSIILLTLPWRLKMVKNIIAKGKFLLVNGGSAKTETMQKIFNKNKFIGFVETPTPTHLFKSHLAYPIGLGDHLTEKSELDCYRNMLTYLDYGSLYFWYQQQVAPITHATLTSYMFPITPVELHNGYIIGKERIITNRSGWYSLGGTENVEAHFFDKNGYEVKRKLESKIKNAKKYYKIVLGKFESCALVKK